MLPSLLGKFIFGSFFFVFSFSALSLADEEIAFFINKESSLFSTKQAHASKPITITDTTIRNIESIRFDSSLDSRTYQTLTEDLKFAQTLSRTPAQTLAQTLNEPILLDGIPLDQWLGQRIWWFVGDQELNPFEVVFLKNQNLCRQYLFQDRLPKILPPPDFLLRKISTMPGGLPVMGNLTPSYFLSAKQEGTTAVVHLKEKETSQNFEFPLTSNRIGVIQVYRHFFESQKINVHPNPRHPLNRIARLSFLVHEARHSDGQAESMGFFHSICPPGHFYEGLEACDSNRNGPYFVQALFLEKVIGILKDGPVDFISTKEDLDALNKLGLLLEDLKTRIISNFPGSPERIKAIEDQLLICDAIPREILTQPETLPEIFRKCANGIDLLKTELSKLYQSGPPTKEWTTIPETCEY